MDNEELQTFNSTLADILTKRSREVVGICDQDCKSVFAYRNYIPHFLGRVMVVMKAEEEKKQKRIYCDHETSLPHGTH